MKRKKNQREDEQSKETKVEDKDTETFQAKSILDANLKNV